MFTLKLYMDDRTRIVSADSFTIYHYSTCAMQVTAHQKDAADDSCFYVGDPSNAVVPCVDFWYERAFIENSSGKTTESICPPLRASMPPRPNVHSSGAEQSGAA
jgi:hypothetical protein